MASRHPSAVRRTRSALKVAAYSATASWVVGIVGLIPALSILRILGLYSLYLLYAGLPVLMKAPADRATGYTIVVIIAAIVVFLLIGVVATRLGGAF
jgi:Yip1-like protein